MQAQSPLYAFFAPHMDRYRAALAEWQPAPLSREPRPRELIASDPDFDMMTREARKTILSDLSPLHWAANNNNPFLCDLLIRNWAQLDVRAKDGRMPLHRAAAHGHHKVVKFLMKKGAPLTELSFEKTVEIMNIEKEVTYPGRNPLHDALANGHDNEFGIQGFDVEGKQKDAIKTVQLLIGAVSDAEWAEMGLEGKTGIRPDGFAVLLCAKHGQSAGDHHIQNEIGVRFNQQMMRVQIMKMLKSKMSLAEWNMALRFKEAGSQRTPLHYAAKWGNGEMVRFLFYNDKSFVFFFFIQR